MGRVDRRQLPTLGLDVPEGPTQVNCFLNTKVAERIIFLVLHFAKSPKELKQHRRAIIRFLCDLPPRVFRPTHEQTLFSPTNFTPPTPQSFSLSHPSATVFPS